jgi:hypothetical protein
MPWGGVVSNYRSTPREQSWPAHAALKIKAAERREAEAERMRAEAAELLRLWDVYLAGRDAKPKRRTA